MIGSWNLSSHAAKRLSLVSGPTAEPLGKILEQGDLPIQVNLNNEVSRLRIANAREMAETILHRKIVQQTWDLFIDDSGYGDQGLGSIYPALYSSGHVQRIALPFPPTQSVIGVYYHDLDGNEYTVDPTTYRLSSGRTERYLYLLPGQVWPVHQGQESFRIRFIAGYLVPFTVDPMTGALLCQNHGYQSGEPVQFTGLDGVMPGPLIVMQNYTVTNLTPTGFQVSDMGGNLIQLDPNFQGTAFIGVVPSPIMRAISMLAALNTNKKIQQKTPGSTKLDPYSEDITPEDLLAPYIWHRL